ncbi:Uncharacterised protein [Actinobacillus ureae]|uniref:Uncharacterized protein n=1 Tax=Actinobacillus ureae ATCC 25976 TaxID=887324 RepID=E8KJQ7_9PAST|nr:hypothetical protein HMPREF0027_2074 [Actinobacillus ureae ATCC 25976]SUT87246.1 Uncharacterised protein [Actinobacillus ureae]SUU48271.1 Uncharacterised protein [Actinobacillus ureae]
MKCEIAKMNAVLIQYAFDHYTAGNKNVFTFKSLYNDEEPYPLEELITCLATHIQILEAEQRIRQSESRQTSIWLYAKRIKQLEPIRKGK